jgi:hypothetical protein
MPFQTGSFTSTFSALHPACGPCRSQTCWAGCCEVWAYRMSTYLATSSMPAARLRTLTADRRLLLVLDNAEDGQQVAAALPATGGCAAIVSARSQLSSLDADCRLRLDGLPSDEALALLIALSKGLAFTDDVAKRIVELCGYLPLTVRIAAGRLVGRPDLTPLELAERLEDRRRRLDELEVDGLAVRSCIRVGYEALASSTREVDRLAAQALRWLGMLNVPEVRRLNDALNDAETVLTAAKAAGGHTSRLSHSTSDRKSSARSVRSYEMALPALFAPPTLTGCTRAVIGSLRVSSSAADDLIIGGRPTLACGVVLQVASGLKAPTEAVVRPVRGHVKEVGRAPPTFTQTVSRAAPVAIRWGRLVGRAKDGATMSDAERPTCRRGFFGDSRGGFAGGVGYRPVLWDDAPGWPLQT